MQLHRRQRFDKSIYQHPQTPRCSMRTITRAVWTHTLSVLLTILICHWAVCEDVPPANKSSPMPLSGHVASAWKDAGAHVGWMRLKAPYVQFLPPDEGRGSDVPALSLSSWKEGILESLPMP